MGATWATVLTIGAEARISPVKFDARASEASAVDTEAWVAAAALAPVAAIRTVRISEVLLTSTSTVEASTPASIAKRLARSASCWGPKSNTSPEAAICMTTRLTIMLEGPYLMMRTIETTRGCGRPDASKARTSKSKGFVEPSGRTGSCEVTNVSVLSCPSPTVGIGSPMGVGASPTTAVWACVRRTMPAKTSKRLTLITAPSSGRTGEKTKAGSSVNPITPRGAVRAIQSYGAPPTPSVPQNGAEWPAGVCVMRASRKVTTPPTTERGWSRW